jgi:hypothetical protein
MFSEKDHKTAKKCPNVGRVTQALQRLHQLMALGHY